MLKLSTLTLMLVLSATFSFAVEEPKSEQLKEIVITDMYKQSVKLEDYNLPYRDGMLVNIWATWCAPCIEELPSLVMLQAILPNITVAAVSIDRHEKIVKNFLKKNKFHPNSLSFLLDKDGTQFKAIGFTQVPTTLLLDNKGNILDVIYGSRNWSNPFMITEIKEKIKQAKRK